MIDYSKLDSSRLFHRKQFVEEVENLIISMGIDNTINKLLVEKATREELKKIDNNIIYIINTVRKKIEGLIRKVPYSKMKFEKQTKLLYWKAILLLKQGKHVSKDKIE